ncbi:MAG: hydrogen peroxide-repsonsive transcriptional regulator OxyR [Saliniramus fredricksonii]|uniref:Hydrogen peroxide-repsonsive transcriptional regulator OxyR n=1 Tax=Saliniramus fredricksonii TaxID=1653334 RepID=A0A0N8KE49_9HYPH|nr:hydrogen peroxide-inducible genes activator [Saliniramus fredricksonii]KPQ10346.1 MAG: hydrogen peroxide-repsonsive transcriptional regulator OxyR [Saliniramus fredricksonii]SCC79679.1 transcriptional regulator, LysR family [Saliniramus fredricksonii]
MNAITLKHLRYFDALARHGHFGRAAEACAISQPALSLQMKELEELLGAQLIERGARQIRLTGLGEALVMRARDILRGVDELGDLARASYSPLTGRLRLGVIPTIAPYLLPQIITRLAARFPLLDLRPREAVTHKLVEDLIEGRLDTAIVALPVSEPSLHEEPLFAEEFVLVRREAEAGKPVPNVESLREMRLLLLEEGHCFREQALSFCAGSGAVPRDLMEGSALSTLVQMVGAGIGVTLIPQMAVAIETRSAPVSVARFDTPAPTRRIGMIWRRTTPLSDQLAEVARIVRMAATGGPQA